MGPTQLCFNCAKRCLDLLKKAVTTEGLLSPIISTISDHSKLVTYGMDLIFSNKLCNSAVSLYMICAATLIPVETLMTLLLYFLRMFVATSLDLPLSAFITASPILPPDAFRLISYDLINKDFSSFALLLCNDERG